MKKTLKTLFLLMVIFTLQSCKEEVPCKGKTTTYTLPDGSTRTIEEPCFENY
ncbi:hypothetical protein [uncultured Tenacibaculum sp.]|uniref:hypothetical protein n=1 Tax=uncultured Tenacibaculum sp. TaxID=174713 RepID=UPI00260D191F|nr:hypothetical protein [uncultured Tenacibaculum sp.]